MSSRPLPFLLLVVLGSACADYGHMNSSPSAYDSDNRPPPEEITDTADTAEEICDDASPVSLYLSPDDSNSMSSPVQAREAALRGANLGGVPIRTWEFMNYYSFAYPAAEEGSLAVSAAMVEGVDGEYVLQIGVSSPALVPAARDPMNLTFVLDTSGSMSGEPIELLRYSCLVMASQLQAGDRVSMVTWDTERNVVLADHMVSGPMDPVLLGAIAGMEAGGGTDLNAGLRAGYGLARQMYDAGRINRIFLVSDGGANTGVTDEEIIGRNAGDEDGEGVYMVGVGVGTPTTYNDFLMDRVTDLGKGASVFIPTEAEARRMFADRFISTIEVAAREVAVRLDLPPGFEIVRFSGEEYSEDPYEIEPQHIAPNDSMVFHQTLRTCAPELVEDETPITIELSWKDPRTFERRTRTLETTIGELMAQDPALLRKGASIFAYAEALKDVRDGPRARATVLDEVRDHLERAEALNPGDTDLLEIRRVIEAL